MFKLHCKKFEFPWLTVKPSNLSLAFSRLECRVCAFHKCEISQGIEIYTEGSHCYTQQHLQTNPVPASSQVCECKIYYAGCICILVSHSAFLISILSLMSVDDISIKFDYYIITKYQYYDTNQQGWLLNLCLDIYVTLNILRYVPKVLFPTLLSLIFKLHSTL